MNYFKKIADISFALVNKRSPISKIHFLFVRTYEHMYAHTYTAKAKKFCERYAIIVNSKVLMQQDLLINEKNRHNNSC